jgi:hypothetical protein
LQTLTRWGRQVIPIITALTICFLVFETLRCCIISVRNGGNTVWAGAFVLTAARVTVWIDQASLRLARFVTVEKWIVRWARFQPSRDVIAVGDES